MVLFRFRKWDSAPNMTAELCDADVIRPGAERPEF